MTDAAAAAPATANTLTLDISRAFTSADHFFAWLLSTAIPAAQADVEKAENFLASPIVSALTKLLGPKAGAAVTDLQTVMGSVLASVAAGGAALAAGGLNVALDAAAVAAAKSLYSAIREALGNPTAVVVQGAPPIVTIPTPPLNPTQAAA